MSLSDLKFPLLSAVALSLIALAPMPYGYYIFLRIVVSACAGLFAYCYYQRHGASPLFWMGIGVGILFNPIITVTLPREIWMILNVLVAGFFGWLVFRLSKNGEV